MSHSPEDCKKCPSDGKCDAQELIATIEKIYTNGGVKNLVDWTVPQMKGTPDNLASIIHWVVMMLVKRVGFEDLKTYCSCIKAAAEATGHQVIPKAVQKMFNHAHRDAAEFVAQSAASAIKRIGAAIGSDLPCTLEVRETTKEEVKAHPAYNLMNTQVQDKMKLH